MKLIKTKVHDYCYTIAGEYGYSTFAIDRDNYLYITFRDGHTVAKSLNVELTYPRTRKTTIEKHVAELYHKIKQNHYRGVVPE